MAVGVPVYHKALFATLPLLEGQATANLAPTGATAGVDITDVFVTRPNAQATILIKGTGTGVLTGIFRIWGYNPTAAEWFPFGTGSDADKGKLNAGAAIGETGTDKVAHAEPLLYAGHFSRIYVELIAPGGTAPSFSAYLVLPRIEYI